jgi:GTP-binding protein
MILVPVGTLIHDADTGDVLRDLMKPGEEIVMATGGRGGLGNATVPHALPGGPGETRRLRLELKLIADVGLIGMPNAGKSSLLSRISTARPKIAAYPFTTRYPVLGVVDVPGRTHFVACDIPGLIEGAHEGKGLGIQFLRHIERTRLLLHLVDMAAVDGREPLEAYRQVNEELAAYSPTLRAKPQLVVANKMDLPEALARLEQFRHILGPEVGPVRAISCATGAGIPDLLHGMAEALEALR